MKRIILAEDVKLTALRTPAYRPRGITNTRGNVRTWIICITRGDERAFFPYFRGEGLSTSYGIDLTAAFKALMLEQAMLTMFPDTESRAGVHPGLSLGQWDRLTRSRTKLMRVLGDEYQRVLDIVLSNLMELADAAA